MAGGVKADRSGPADATSLRATASAYAELVRVPNLFTAPPDVVLGAALVAASGHSVSVTVVGGLAVASMALYAGGTTLNDAFDAPDDVHARPERPIPSDRVTRRTAFGLGFAFLLTGTAVAFVTAGRRGAIVAGAIAAAIVLYDGVAKGTTAGFLTMGATRGLNVILGTTAVAVSLSVLPLSVFVVPAVVAIYIAAVTYMAADETIGENSGAVAVTGAGAAIAALTVGWYLGAVSPSTVDAVVAVGFAGAFLWLVGRPLRAAYADPTPDTVGPAVGACVLGLVLLDAAFAAGTGIEWALAAALFLVPARVLSRVFDVT